MPPGPNGPVGVAWLDLTKEHYGIHGTNEPQTIGRAESSGCIRMTNWDVLRLSRMHEAGVQGGVPGLTAARRMIRIARHGGRHRDPDQRLLDLLLQHRRRADATSRGHARRARRSTVDPAGAAAGAVAEGVTVGPAGPRHPGRRREGRASLVDTYTQARAGGARRPRRDRHHGRRGHAGGRRRRRARSRSCSFSQGGGGITVYVRSPDQRWIYYYAHLQGYAPGLAEGQQVQRGAADRPRRPYRQRQSGRPAPPFRHQPDGAGREVVAGDADQSLSAACRKAGQRLRRVADSPARARGGSFITLGR